MILTPLFFKRDSLTVARELLGKRLVVISEGVRLSWIICETEAYRGQDDPASHAYPGITPRNRYMYETYGHVYVYFVYGMHYCLNFTTEDHGIPGAILIRWVIPEEGVNIMEQRRGQGKVLSDGPGKLCEAFGITSVHNGLPLGVDSSICLEDTKYPLLSTIKSGPRIGIWKWQEKEWRFWL